jgi:hypothetical protein
MYSSKTFNTKATSIDTEEAKTWPPKVTHRNPKTGQVIRQDNYIMRTVGSLDKNNRDRVNYVEFPAGSGNLWSKNWEPAGRWDAKQPEGKRYLKDAVHVDWTPPETQDQVLAKEMAQDKQRIAQLEKELSAIRDEQADVKSVAKKKDSGA